MASQALCAFGAGVYACVCLVDDRFVYSLECVRGKKGEGRAYTGQEK